MASDVVRIARAISAFSQDRYAGASRFNRIFSIAFTPTLHTTTHRISRVAISDDAVWRERVVSAMRNIEMAVRDSNPDGQA